MRYIRHLPNALTLLRLLSAPALAALLCSHGAAWHAPAAFALFVAAALTDHLDGFLARRLKAETAWGRQIDPLADKLLITAALLGMAVTGTLGGFHLIAVAVILSREIIVSVLREWLVQRGAELPVMPLARIKTAAQCGGIGLLLAAPLWDTTAAAADAAGLALLWTAAALTAWTGILYLRRGVGTLRRLAENVS